jgi:uncharacterized membrane protein
VPYQWSDGPESGQTSLTLRPYRSLPVKGFVTVIGGLTVMLFLPLLALLGTALLWGILPFILIVIGGTWWAFSRNYRDATLTEVLTLRRDRIDLVRRAPDGSEQHWTANPYWVAVSLYPTKGPVPNYLTLKGQGREVELGSFLTEAERQSLADDLRERLAALR